MTMGSRLRRLSVALTAALMLCAAPAATLPDAEALMNWAESVYAREFPGPQATRSWQQYRYRHYPQTGNYVGVAGEDIYVFGPVSGNATSPLRVGRLADFACQVYPVSCVAAIDKPTGTFASAPRDGIYAHPQLRGVLVRVAWSQIEPRAGQFDLQPLEQRLAPVRAAGLSWTLSVGAGGPGTPAWLIDSLGAPFLAYKFRGTTPYKLPLFWDATVQQRLASLAQRLGEAYGDDSKLKLVVVPQMTANGIEGHLNGIDMNQMRAAGYTDERWVDASLAVTRAFASAFPNKALAFEVHEIDRSAVVPRRILDALKSDATLGGRVGAAMWWISGRTDYQADLIGVLKEWTGDLYGQVIARSDDSSQFADGDYASVFAQAKALRMRYIEPWEYDFGTGSGTANGRWDKLLEDFNKWSATQFAAPPAQQR